MEQARDKFRGNRQEEKNVIEPIQTANLSAREGKREYFLEKLNKSYN